MKMLSEPDFNPFEHETTDSDIDEAAPASTIVETSDNDDEDIDISSIYCFYILILYSIFIFYIVSAKNV